MSKATALSPASFAQNNARRSTAMAAVFMTNLLLLENRSSQF
jgi:hypothetical protein